MIIRLLLLRVLSHLIKFLEGFFQIINERPLAFWEVKREKFNLRLLFSLFIKVLKLIIDIKTVNLDVCGQL
jgi:hypothetical protein